MDKVSFDSLFQEAIRRAFAAAHVTEVQQPLVLFVGNPNPAEPISTAKTLDLLWLTPKRFYRVVDVAVIPEGDSPIIFVRPSGHEPAAFQETLDPSDLGPFNILTSDGSGTKP